MKYVVERHSGRRCDKFKTILETDDGDKARELYEQKSLELRQGCVRLSIGGTIANETSAPRFRFRSRW